MSRIGKKPIEIPKDVNVAQDGKKITVTGPKGELSRSFKESVKIMIGDGVITLKPMGDSKAVTSLWGTYGSHLTNMISGVVTPFEKKLIVEGVGFRAEISGDTLTMSLGFSHKVEMKVPKDLVVSVEKNVITVSGIDKELVGQFAAEVRGKRKPEPYKGKGIRYEGEIIKRKEGKKSV